MVEHSINLDLVFGSLSDPTRRDILKHVSKQTLSIKELSERYQMTFAGIAKHVHILEKAKLIRKRKEGRQQILSANPKVIALSQKYLQQYEKILSTSYHQLDNLLNT